MKDLVIFLKNIVECLLFVRFYDRCRAYSGEKRFRFIFRVDIEVMRGLWVDRGLELVRGGCMGSRLDGRR